MEGLGYSKSCDSRLSDYWYICRNTITLTMENKKLNWGVPEWIVVAGVLIIVSVLVLIDAKNLGSMQSIVVHISSVAAAVVTTKSHTNSPFNNGAVELKEMYLRIYGFDYQKATCSSAGFTYDVLG